mmetsp:Transcript_48915/g.104017  ORF Transcript_48915/g.104017 Transcript_48915/m.104017 type:complete len:239 (+) Transcript_48915:44-760(+)
MAVFASPLTTEATAEPPAPKPGVHSKRTSLMPAGMASAIRLNVYGAFVLPPPFNRTVLSSASMTNVNLAVGAEEESFVGDELVGAFARVLEENSGGGPFAETYPRERVGGDVAKGAADGASVLLLFPPGTVTMIVTTSASLGFLPRYSHRIAPSITAASSNGAAQSAILHFRAREPAPALAVPSSPSPAAFCDSFGPIAIRILSPGPRSGGQRTMTVLSPARIRNSSPGRAPGGILMR